MAKKGLDVYKRQDKGRSGRGERSGGYRGGARRPAPQPSGDPEPEAAENREESEE